jgi:hypothetical protein
MLVEEILKQISNNLDKANPTRDFSRNITLTGSAIALPNEACKQCTIFNTLTTDVIVTLNAGSNLTIPSNFGGTFAVNNTNEITVNGTNLSVLTYIVGQ